MRSYISANSVAIGMIAAVVGLVIYGVGRQAPDATPSTRLGARGGPTTSRTDLLRTIERMETRLERRATDRDAAILLADALMRQARVTGDTALTRRAVEAVKRVVSEDSADYEARRMLATAYAAEHRFRDAAREAGRAREQQPHDPWNYGIIGDSHLELGEYEEAFAAFQRMLDLRPSAAAYSRVSYAFELQGKLEDAVQAMKLAADAASPRDPESIAWFHAHLADLYMDLGRLSDARLAYAWAERAFADHPFVRAGIARLKEAEGDTAGALALYRQQFDKLGSPELATALGELYERSGNATDAERMYALAEAGWRAGGPSEQDHLARFLADHDRKITEAVQLAEAGAARDIVAQDALAWAYFKAGRLAEADRAATSALRTGTRNFGIIYHAAAIRHALGDHAGARTLLDRAPNGTRRFIRVNAAVQSLRGLLNRPETVASR